MKRPRVLMVSGNGPPLMCGIGDFTGNLLSKLQESRPDWSWIWMCRRARWFHSPLGRFQRVNMIRPVCDWRRGEALAALCAQALRPDIIHIQDEMYSFFQTDAAVRIASSAGCPVVATLHEYHSDHPDSRHTASLARRADTLITQDRRAAERCRSATGRSPDVQGWTPSNVPVPPRKIPPHPGLISTFGFLTPLVRLEAVFLALQRLREGGLPLRWRIIGPLEPMSNPYHAELRARFSQPWVEFTGGFPTVDDPRLQKNLAESEIMVLPYADGASPRRTTLQAAWAFGLPVVTTPPPLDEPGFAPGGNCLFVAGFDPADWAAAIGSLHDNPALRERLAAGALKTAERFSLERLARMHLEIYERMLRN